MIRCNSVGSEFARMNVYSSFFFDFLLLYRCNALRRLKDPKKCHQKQRMMSYSSLTDFFLRIQRKQLAKSQVMCARDRVCVCASVQTSVWCVNVQTRVASFDEIILYKRKSNSKWFEALAQPQPHDFMWIVAATVRFPGFNEEDDNKKGACLLAGRCCYCCCTAPSELAIVEPKAHKVNQKYSAKYAFVFGLVWI